MQAKAGCSKGRDVDRITQGWMTRRMSSDLAAGFVPSGSGCFVLVFCDSPGIFYLTLNDTGKGAFWGEG